MLLEMPYGVWSQWVYKVVDELIARGIRPIMAHIERYNQIVGIEPINELMSRDVLGQMNIYSLSGAKGLCKRLVKNNMVHVLGSDVHHKRQLNQVARFYDLVRHSIGEDVLTQINENGHCILENQEINRGPIKAIKKIGMLYL